MSNTRTNQLHHNQAGLMSFIVAIIIMILLSLIVLAFGRLVRREQRQTLDRQLNTQAFYAAESGVNDAVNALKAFPALTSKDYDECTGPNSFVDDANALGAGLNPAIDDPIVYSCLLVDNSLPELNYKEVATSQSTTVPINAAGGSPISTLEISWEDTAIKTPNLAGCPGFFPTLYPDNWPATCQIGVLRLELVPFTGARTRDDLVRQRAITFVSPQGSGGNANLNFSGAAIDNQGLRQMGDCSGGGPGPRRCTLRITLDAGAAGMQTGYLRMRSVYRPTEVTIRAFNGANQLELTGAQVQIDVTGRANDILKRVRVARPLESDGDLFPEFALQSKSTQCKRMAVSPPNIAAPDNSGVVASQQPYCDPGQL
jgi:Tfp pilus assembly protein PilX